MLRDLFAPLKSLNDPESEANFGHIGQFGHVVALPKLQSIKLHKNNINREYIKVYSTGTGAAVPKVPQVPAGRFINVGSALPDIAAAIQESGSVALDLETYARIANLMASCSRLMTMPKSPRSIASGSPSRKAIAMTCLENCSVAFQPQ